VLLKQHLYSYLTSPVHAKVYQMDRNWKWVCAGWRYDQNFQVVDYTFSKLDLTTMANISGGDQRLWVHLLSAWVISWFVWRVSSWPCF
jgi:hypothetical protein